MRRVCCECELVMDEGSGPEDMVSHGLCPVCFEAAMAEIEAYQNEKGERGTAHPSVKIEHQPR